MKLQVCAGWDEILVTAPSQRTSGIRHVQHCHPQQRFLIQTLYNHGIRSAQELAVLEREFLAQFPTVSEENVDTVLTHAAEVAKLEEAEQAAAIARLQARAGSGAGGGGGEAGRGGGGAVPMSDSNA